MTQESEGSLPLVATAGIREMRSEPVSTQVGCGDQQNPGIRRLSLRAEIDTSPPFGSVKEAVNRFGGSGPWVPFYKLADNCHGIEEIDIKKVEEQATALEKDLIVKELETLDILEELTTTKRIVEELKRQLKTEALKCMKQGPPSELPPDIKKMNNEEKDTSPSSDLIRMELKQAKSNLGRTINELGVIQNSVENLNKKMKKEKDLMEKILEIKEANGGTASERDLQMTSNGCEVKIKMVDQGNRTSGEEQSKLCMRTAEMRLIAAKKMEEAAKAAEALAIAEIKSLSAGNSEEFYGFFVPEPEQSPPTPRIHMVEDVQNKQVVHPIQKFAEPNFSPFSISKKLQEATQEVKQSKMALEEALGKMELANKKQIAAEEALRSLMPEHEQSPLNTNHFNPSDHPLHRPPQRSPLHALMNPNPLTNEGKPILMPTVSMRDVLSRKQVTPEECVVRRQREGQNGRQKVALSQMLQQVRENVAFPAKRERDGEEQRQPQFYAPRTERRRFGFIHIALPMAKQSKKKSQVLN